MIVFFFASVMLLIIIFFHQKGTGIREAIIKSYLVLFFLIAGSTEIASLFDAITYRVLSLFWLIVAVVLSIFTLFFLNLSNTSPRIRVSLIAIGKTAYHEGFFLLLLGVILTITLFLGLLSPPNTWDSMTYHMARVAHWIQHGNIDFYPTSIIMQNHHMPLSEFAMLHLQLINKTDTFVNTVQWYAFCVAIVLASLITREFKTSMRVQFFSAVVAATIPMAILQSSGSQNDLVTAAFCLSFAYFLLRLVKSLSLEAAVFCGLSLGLALLTKATAYLYVFGTALIVVITHLSLHRTWKAKWMVLRALTFVVIVGLAINIGHLSRKYNEDGHIIFNEQISTLTMNEKLSVTLLCSNIIRNIAVHLGTPIKQLNRYVMNSVEKLLGDQLNNPQSTYAGTKFGLSFSLHEGYAGNLLHLLLYVLVFLCLPLVKKERRSFYSFAGSIVFSAILYSAVLKWQPWGSRLVTPLFMLSAPVVAVVLASVPSIGRRVFVSLSIVLFVLSIPFLLSNPTRPLIPLQGRSVLSTKRLEQYFYDRPYLYDDYVAAVEIAMDENVDTIGLYLGCNDWEYPLWVLTGRHAIKGRPHFRHVKVGHILNSMDKQRVPAPVLVLATKRFRGNIIEGKEYVTIFLSKHIRALKLKNS